MFATEVLNGRQNPVENLARATVQSPSWCTKELGALHTKVTPMVIRLRGEGSKSISSDQGSSIGSTANSIADAPSSPPPSPPPCTVEPLGAPETAAEVPVSGPGLPTGIAVSASGGIDHERLDRQDRLSRLDRLDRLDRFSRLDRLDALDRADACAARLAASQKIVL